MRKYTYIVIVTLLCSWFLSCSSDGSSSENGGPGSGPDGKGGSLATFALVGDYLYAVDNFKLNVFSLIDPENATSVGSVDVGFDIETLFSFDDFLFVGAQTGMYIYDISHPESPRFLSKSLHFTACDPVVANKDFAFVTLHSNSVCGNAINSLTVYDIADPKAPVKVHSRNMISPRGLALFENYLIICDDELKIFDVADAANPVFKLSKPNTYKDVAIYNNTLFAFGENRVSQYKWTNGDFLSLELVSTLTY